MTLPIVTGDRTPRWTGGQYSVFRGAFGIFLLVRFALALPHPALFTDRALAGAPWFIGLLLGAGCLFSVLFAAGWADRAAAIALGGVLLALSGRDPFGDGGVLLFFCWLLLAHALLPPAPYGSSSAHRRPDPGAGWTMPDGVRRATWAVLLLGYGVGAFLRFFEPAWIDGSALARALEDSLVRPAALGDLLQLLPEGVLRAATYGTLAIESAFVPLVAVGRIRPWLWTLLLSMHLARIIFSPSGDASIGLAAVHLFAFNPGWVAPRPARGTSTLFYDGGCGLCHRSVRFLLAEDPDGRAFRFATLEGAAFRKRFGAADRRSLPDSLIVVSPTGELLTKSRAVLHLLCGIGGLWRVLALLLALVPRFLLDRAYDRLAAIRHRLFRRPDRACPLLTPALLERFDDTGIAAEEAIE